jgi:Uma2 family endonuclease
MRNWLTEPRHYCFSRGEFEEMSRNGWLAGQAAELIDGAVVVRTGSNGPGVRRWTRDEYIQMSECGWFTDCKVELIGGEVIEMASQLNAHAAGVTLTSDALRATFGPGYWVRSQATIDLSPHGMPDPDVAVVPGSPRTAPPRGIPTTALLVVEISESTLGADRNAMASLYAAGGIADYWIVNLVQRQLEVHRNPAADRSKLFGFGYSSRIILDPGDAIAPLAAPHAHVAVADLLP